MAIEKLSPVSRYLGDGVQTIFPVGFPVFGDGRHVKAVISTGGGSAFEERPLAYGIDYSVSIVSKGGECVTAAPVPDGCALTLYLDLPAVQPRDFDNQGRLDAEEIEKGLDYVTALAAQNAAAMARTVKVPFGGPLSAEALLSGIFSAGNEARAARAEACACAEHAAILKDELLEIGKDLAMTVASRDAPLFSIAWDMSGLEDFGYVDISQDAGLLSRALFKGAWSKILRMIARGFPNVIADEAWLAERTAAGFCDKFSTGDGESTFRIPHVPLEYWHKGCSAQSRETQRWTFPAQVSTSGKNLALTVLAPGNGLFIVRSETSIASGFIILEVNGVARSIVQQAYAGSLLNLSAHVRKGDVMKLYGGGFKAGDYTVNQFWGEYGAFFHAFSGPVLYPRLKLHSADTAFALDPE